MAVMQSRDTRSFVAGESLAAAQFKFVTLESDGQVGARQIGTSLMVTAKPPLTRSVCVDRLHNHRE